VKHISIGIIGLGRMGQSHIKQIENFPHMQIKAICDVNEAVKQETGDRLGIAGNKRYSDYNELISDPDIHVVVSVTPNNLHAEVIKKCLLERKVFMAEKPFTRLFSEAVELIELYQQNPIPCMIGFSYRYLPQFRYLKYLIQSGKIGVIRSVSGIYFQSHGSSVYKRPRGWRYDQSITGTGTLGDLGSHLIDMSRFLIGEFTELSAHMKTFIESRENPLTGIAEAVDVDDFASIHAVLDHHIPVVLQTSRIAFGGAGNQLEMTLYGDSGTLKVDCENEHTISWVHPNDEKTSIVHETLAVPPEWKMSQWSEFAQLIEGNAPTDISGLIDGYINQEVVEAIIISNREKRTITPSSLRPSLSHNL
jgi:predicted dehydrogenase